MVIFNKKKMFLESFIKETKQEFEDFKPRDVQSILLSLINEEFNIDTYFKQKIILEHFPIHNFKQKFNIIKEWNKDYFWFLVH